MKLSEIVRFRKDLLFDGAVQVNWFEEDRALAEKAAEHFVFHGPDYHGVAGDEVAGGGHRLVDTANFTLDILERLWGDREGDPFLLAIAGYGTGKSHLGLTLSVLLSNPSARASSSILTNLSRAEEAAGRRAEALLSPPRGPSFSRVPSPPRGPSPPQGSRPYLVVALNGMLNFDLSGEITRQVMLRLDQEGLDISPLVNLKPRFAVAQQFTRSYFPGLKDEFQELFGRDCTPEDILEGLKCQKEEVFSKVSQVYYQEMGSHIRAAGQESLQDFIRVAAENYCGEGKPFRGIFLLFDEFGHYLEYAARYPYVAGPGALQQLFEGVQNTRGKVFLLCFIQHELKAYSSRVAPENQGDLGRYLGRYDSVRKVRLSSNLETLLANLLEKKDEGMLDRLLAGMKEGPGRLQASLLRWFPTMGNHALWQDRERFRQVIVKGCWPLHPLSTWVLYWLSSIGNSLQMRSAFSFIADIYEGLEESPMPPGGSIVPAGLCTGDMIKEFQSAGGYGYQDKKTLAYLAVLEKYQYEFSPAEEVFLKGVLVSSQVGYKVEDREDCLGLLAVFSGLEREEARGALYKLESEYGALAWDQAARRFEIMGEAVSRAVFRSYLDELGSRVDSQGRVDLFCHKFQDWTGNKTYETDCAARIETTTREWHYQVYYSSVSRMAHDVEKAFGNWRGALGVDKPKGQLLYVYLGPESCPAAVGGAAREAVRASLKKCGPGSPGEAPVVVQLLHDREGALGQKMVEFWHLKEEMGDEERAKYANYIPEETGRVEKEMLDQFFQLEKARHLIFATRQEIKGGRIKNMLEELFQAVYPRALPFPFDGFHTARGHAARDSQTFIKEMFLGNLDNEWIAAQAVPVRNRAAQVLVGSWGALAEDGSLRLKPGNKNIKDMFEELETWLEEGSLSRSTARRGELQGPGPGRDGAAGPGQDVFPSRGGRGQAGTWPGAGELAAAEQPSREIYPRGVPDAWETGETEGTRGTGGPGGAWETGGIGGPGGAWETGGIGGPGGPGGEGTTWEGELPGGDTPGYGGTRSPSIPVARVREMPAGQAPGGGEGARLPGGEAGKQWQPVSLGEVLRYWCGPPFGCNLASAGLLLALFAGARKDRLELRLDQERASVEEWLQAAMPKHFLDVEVLDKTTLLRVSGEGLSEWESLLDEWEAEVTLRGKVEYWEKGKELLSRAQVPRQLFYKHENLKNLAEAARQEIDRVEAALQGAREDVAAGSRGQDAALLCRGAAVMQEIYRQLMSQEEKWYREQTRELKDGLDRAVYLARESFKPWLEGQQVQAARDLPGFREAVARVKGDLEVLGLPEEIALLEEHREKVTAGVKLAEGAQKVIRDIRLMLQKDRATPTTPVYALKDLLGEIQGYREELVRLQGAGCSLTGEIEAAAGELRRMQEACESRLGSYQKRLEKISGIQDVYEVTRIVRWQNEISSLLTAYENQGETQFLYAVQKQLRLVEEHLKRLKEKDLDQMDFDLLCQVCRTESQELYLFDSPPLDNETIYGGIIEKLIGEREEKARQWMQKNVPGQGAIRSMAGEKAVDYLNRMKNPPRLLSFQQEQQVRQASRACEKRLDELQVEGLFSKFQAMSGENQKTFVRKVQEFLEQETQATQETQAGDGS